MKIGVMADSHDNAMAIEKALALFAAEDAHVVFHLGDLCEPALFAYFQQLDFYFVQGNNDPALSEINLALQKNKMRAAKIFHELDLDGKKICLMHGDDVRLFRSKVAEKKFDYLLKGHTHFPEDYHKENLRILNPGALYRTSRYTVAMLDTQTDDWQLHTIV